MKTLDLSDTDVLIKTMQQRLHQRARRDGKLADAVIDPRQVSAVLFLLGNFCSRPNSGASPCIVLNLRSALVRQPGDLCCPGGGISPWLDAAAGRLLTLPAFSLTRWPYWTFWQKHRPGQTKNLAVLYATALREGLEEMRLNPLGLTFLGPLPSQHLVMFKRVIFPQAAWINSQTRFFPNWEVERIVYLPLAELLNPANYARYHLKMSFNGVSHPTRQGGNDFLCYRHRHAGGTDILWGATFRITMDFLNLIFGFQPPDIRSLPTVEGLLDDTYLSPGGAKS